MAKVKPRLPRMVLAWVTIHFIPSFLRVLKSIMFQLLGHRLRPVSQQLRVETLSEGEGCNPLHGPSAGR